MNKYTNLHNLDVSELSVPQFVDCGMILLKNVHKEDMIHESLGVQPQLEDSSKLFGYYIIPQYDFSLE